jgi:DMSO/TMAO reductase YedYZ molybdopterin-dependent catalytic subunit
MPSRRDLLRASTAWGALTLLGDSARLFERLLAQTICPDAGPLGDLVHVMPFLGERAAPTPLGTIVGGEGLDARLFTDLSELQPNRLITPTAKVFVRTAAPKGVSPNVLARWDIAIRGVDRAPTLLPMRDLLKVAKPMGAHLIECAGNSDPQNFGLMSVAEWQGVSFELPLEPIYARDKNAAGVLVSGWDHEGQASARSIPGASWVFPLGMLEKLGAFMATGMNGEPLPLDHGAPVRLVVPRWYGCSWIKWVNEIRLVRDEEPPTSQMREFATRTHQDGMPARALDYAPPVIDLAATPIRIEKRRIDGRLEYRVVGIVWGGQNAAERTRVMIRFNPTDSFKAFAVCPTPTTHRTWSLWEYRWRPTAPGTYSIVLQAASPDIRARRLDLSFYIRRVVIDEV